MAKIQVVFIMSMDGFLPDNSNPLAHWVKNSKQGLPYWHEQKSIPLHPHYPLLDLINKKKEGSNSNVYLAEISTEESLNLLYGLFLYHLVDEMIIYLLPVILKKGKSIHDLIPVSSWKLKQISNYKNGICSLVYTKV